MALQHTARRPLVCSSCLFRNHCLQSQASRAVANVTRERLTAEPPGWRTTRIPKPEPRAPQKRIKIYPPPPSVESKYPFAVQDVDKANLRVLDPGRSRRRLFDPYRRYSLQPGDLLLTTFHHGDPFAGYCLSIRRRGVDTSILIRNKVDKVGAEMWIKVFSPNVKGIEIVKRPRKGPRRARPYYYRTPGKRAKGDVRRIVNDYLREKRLIRSGTLGVRQPGSSSKKRGSAR